MSQTSEKWEALEKCTCATFFPQMSLIICTFHHECTCYFMCYIVCVHLYSFTFIGSVDGKYRLYFIVRQ